eukprot:4710179-Prymnesium_polylepis.1
MARVWRPRLGGLEQLLGRVQRLHGRVVSLVGHRRLSPPLKLRLLKLELLRALNVLLHMRRRPAVAWVRGHVGEGSRGRGVTW